jgi:hypothetical protein
MAPQNELKDKEKGAGSRHPLLLQFKLSAHFKQSARLSNLETLKP